MIGVGGIRVEVGGIVLERRVVFDFIAAVIEVDGDSHHIAPDDGKLLVGGLGWMMSSVFYSQNGRWPDPKCSR